MIAFLLSILLIGVQPLIMNSIWIDEILSKGISLNIKAKVTTTEL